MLPTRRTLFLDFALFVQYSFYDMGKTKKKKKTDRQKSIHKNLQTAGLVIAIALVGLVLLWPYLRLAFLTLVVPIGRGTPGILEDRISGNAIYAGGQEILVAPVSGTIKFLYESGESVRSGDTVCEVMPPESNHPQEIKATGLGVFFNDIVVEDLVLSSADLSQKDASELTILCSELADSQPVSIEDGYFVSEGEMVGRVGSGENVNFYMVVKTEERPDLSIGDKAEIEMNESQYDCIITSVIDGKPPGYSIISGEIDYVPPEKYARTAYTWLIACKREGIIVPSQSLVEKDGQVGVLVVQKTYARFRPVEVLMVKGDQAVIKGIDETSEIVLRGMAFFDGRRVR